ncbi:MAG: hypothetical protein ABS75_17000 [Pelagibacterium sp. SCN 63-23]|nr:MAG: hypothetical protein ABS75_17000 [Pelagibacterium sp. SCN 63-23]
MRSLAPPLFVLLLLAAPASAQDILKPIEDFVEEIFPSRAPQRPAPKPIPAAQPTPVDERPDAAAMDEAQPPLPRPRPEAAAEAPEPEIAAEPEAEAEPGSEASKVVERVYQTACPALLSGRVTGDMLPPIADGICGERSPLSLRAIAVNGRPIALSGAVETNCAMAGALADWVEEVDAYADAAFGSGIEQVDIGTGYMCRKRNGAADGFTSEHGFANALDIVGFSLADGSTLTVEGDWRESDAAAGKLLRQAHGAACARFTTVLGPEANAEHEDHLHLDLGCHGRTCTARICE